MTSTSKGIDPLLPPGGRSFPVHSNRISTHSFPQPPRSWPRQTSVPDFNALATDKFQDTSEPPLKKLKLGDPSPSSEGGPAVGGTPKSPISDHAIISDLTSSTRHQEKDSRTCPQSLFPLRPGEPQSRGTFPYNRPSTNERAARKDAVPVKAYAPEPPPCAPEYHGKGECLLLYSDWP